MTLLTTEGLSRNFGGVLAVDAVNFNLTQGEILLLGALFIWTFTLGVKLPWGIGVPIALVCCVGMALILERALFRPLIGESPFTVFMASIALLILLRGIAQLVWGQRLDRFRRYCRRARGASAHSW